MNDEVAGEPLEIAIVGLGRFGQYLGEVIRSRMPSMSVTALVEPDDSLRRTVAREYGVPGFGSLDQLLAEGGDLLEAAVLTSPNFVHAAQGVALAQAGKHVFCEKPMAISGAECEAMVTAAEQNSVYLMVGHKRRLRPAWARLLELIGTGELGAVVGVNVEGWHYHDDIAPWWLQSRTGGGLLHQAGVHDVDFCNAALGEPAWVEAMSAGRQRSSDLPTALWVTIGYEGGAVAGLQVAAGFVPIKFKESFSVSVLGTEGCARLSSTATRGQTVTWGASASSLAVETYPDGYELAYTAELASFVSWIRDRNPPVLSWRDGWQAVRVMEAAYAAAAHRSRVALAPLRPMTLW